MTVDLKQAITVKKISECLNWSGGQFAAITIALFHVAEKQSFSLSPFQFILQEVDITLPENSAWYDRYKFDIPVFHLNGQFLMMHRVNLSTLEKQLQKLEQQGAGS